MLSARVGRRRLLAAAMDPPVDVVGEVSTIGQGFTGPLKPGSSSGRHGGPVISEPSRQPGFPQVPGDKGTAGGALSQAGELASGTTTAVHKK